MSTATVLLHRQTVGLHKTEFRTDVCVQIWCGATRYCLELLMCNLANFLSSMYVLLEVINILLFERIK